MAIERARVQALAKPWGVRDPRPWSAALPDGASLGELWYERPGSPERDPLLLLKLLFTSQPLSIQVHPDDAFARSMGEPHGKTEAWYILSAGSEAKVALGLKQRLTAGQLRAAVEDGSIADLIEWQEVVPGDIVFVPAGTIHAIGAGLVLAEVQQRSDVTFRMFDFGRKRELHVESAVAVSDAGPAGFGPRPRRLDDARTLLVSSPPFVLERIELAPESVRRLGASRETWLLLLKGEAHAGPFDLSAGDAVFTDGDRVNIRVGAGGMTALVAYPGPEPAADLLGQPGSGRPATSPAQA